MLAINLDGIMNASHPHIYVLITFMQPSILLGLASLSKGRSGIFNIGGIGYRLFSCSNKGLVREGCVPE